MTGSEVRMQRAIDALIGEHEVFRSLDEVKAAAGEFGINSDYSWWSDLEANQARAIAALIQAALDHINRART